MFRSLNLNFYRPKGKSATRLFGFVLGGSSLNFEISYYATTYTQGGMIG